MIKRNIYSYLLVILISIICIIPSLFCIVHKNQLHLDEVWTYSLSNSTQGPFLYVWRTGIGDDSVPTRYVSNEKALNDTNGYFFQKWHSGEEFKKYITVQQGERFHYSNVLYNQSCDVHPPLYYLLIHTICSLFPNSFSVWYAFIPNLIFMVGAIFLLHNIIIILGLDEVKSIIITSFWALSRAGISDIIFLRMYMMLTFITLLSVYLNIKLFDEQKISFIFYIFLVNLAGFLTQYYYYIYCFFLTLILCIYLFLKKRIRIAIVYGCSVLCTIGLAILIFPATIKQVFHGAYTESSAITGKPINKVLSWIGISIKDFVGATSILDSLPVTVLLYGLASFAVIFIVIKIYRLRPSLRSIINTLQYKFSKRSSIYWMFLLIISLTGSLLGMVSPQMPLYQDRYYFNILPIIAIYFIDLITTVIKYILNYVHVSKLSNLLIIIVSIVLVCTSNLSTRNNYIDYDNNSIDLAEALKGNTCFVAMKQDLRIHIYPIYFQNAEQIYVSHDVNELLYSEINSFEGDNAYILVQFAMQSVPSIKSLIDNINYQVTVLDFNIETTLGYKDNDALLIVDYTKPK